MRTLFGTDGVRGVANIELSAELATKIGRGLVSVIESQGINNPTILIGTDTRLSSHMLYSALEAGILSKGGDAICIGVCSTPGVAFLLKKHGFDAGVVISASHNPYQYNGIKIFGRDGFKLSDELEEKIEDYVFERKSTTPSPDKIGMLRQLDGMNDEYIDHLANSFNINLSGLRIGIDCANGAASVTAERLFTKLGCSCTMLGNSPNGLNINKNCGSTNLESLKALVIKNGLDAGIAFDGDADRCLAVDEKGNEVDGDYIMAILASSLKEKGALAKNTVVGTVMSNLGFELFCKKKGIDFVRAKVGDRYVLEIMNREGYSFGGEQSGHLIFSDYATTGDGQLTAVALLSCLKESGKSLSALATVMKKYPQFTVNIDADAEMKSKFKKSDAVKKILENTEAKIGTCGRILVRPSGTEPLIRVMAEGLDEKGTRELCEEAAKKIRDALKD